MLSMIQQSVARKTLNVNRTGVADSKLATLKLSSTANTSNVLSLIRGNSTPATNISANLTLSKSNTTTDNTANITVDTADEMPMTVTSIALKNSDGTTTTISTTDGKVATVGTPETVDIPRTVVFDTTGKADITLERLDTLNMDINTTDGRKPLLPTDKGSVIINVDVANFHKNFVTDDTPATDGNNTPEARIAELDAAITSTQSKTIDSVLPGSVNAAHAAQGQVNQTLSLLDDTNASTTANINLPTTFNRSDNQQPAKLNDASIALIDNLIESMQPTDTDAVTYYERRAAELDEAERQKYREQVEQSQWYADSKAMEEYSKTLPTLELDDRFLGGTNTSTSANWGDNQQSDLLDDASTTFTGTTSLPQMDLDSITQPSSAGGTMTDWVDELNKVTQNDPRIASAKALVEQANQQPPGTLQLLQ